MNIKLIAKNDTGKIAIEKLSREKGKGKQIISVNPFTLEIQMDKIPVAGALLRRMRDNPAVLDMIRTTWINTLKQYGAAISDFEVHIE